MSQDEFATTQSQVREIVALAEDAMDLYERFYRPFVPQIAEVVASIQPDLTMLKEAVRQIAHSGIGEALQDILPLIAGMNGVSGISTRRREATFSIAASSQPLPVPTTQELREAEVDLRRHLPETPDQVKRVEELSETITADPRQRELIKRVREIVEQADFSKVPPITLSALLYWWFCHALSLPLTGEVTPARASDYLGVVTVVLTVLFGLWPRS